MKEKTFEYKMVYKTKENKYKHFHFNAKSMSEALAFCLKQKYIKGIVEFTLVHDNKNPYRR